MQRTNRASGLLVVVVMLFSGELVAGETTVTVAPVGSTMGWRGNWTGLFPDANPVTEWDRTPTGPIQNLVCQATKPQQDQISADAKPLYKGLIRDWLVAGPFDLKAAVDFDKELIPSEAALAPDLGEQQGALKWQAFSILPSLYKGSASPACGPEMLELKKVLADFKPNQAAYAHTYLYCQMPGKLAMVFEHCYGLKLWLNGDKIYEERKDEAVIGLSYFGIGKMRANMQFKHSPKLELDLKKGWNRLLLKICSSSTANNCWFSARFAPSAISYEDRNIVWAAKLPGRSNYGPIIVGNRIFTTAEPDELICLDKNSGQILWRRMNGLYEATPESAKKGIATFVQIDPLARQLETCTDPETCQILRRQISELLISIDAQSYKLRWDQHFTSHFEATGFVATPCSDGNNVFVSFNTGVHAAYTLEGKRLWITRTDSDFVSYPCSPAIIGDKLVVYRNKGNGETNTMGVIFALNKMTGEQLWRQEVKMSHVSLVPAAINNEECIALPRGELLRARDGKILYTAPRGIAPALFLGNKMYRTQTAFAFTVSDFSKVSGDSWTPEVLTVPGVCQNKVDGRWVDHWMFGAPLVYDGIAYLLDQLGWFYAIDLQTNQLLYRQELDSEFFHTYISLGFSVSPTLGGKYVYVWDNQGTCFVIQHGREFKVVAKNRINTIIQQPWPIRTQELLGNSAPIFEGERMYIRGEQNLYCIGKN